MSYGQNVSGFEIREFTGPARIAGPSAQHVVRGLEAAAPSDSSAEERAALMRAILAADVVQACLLDREQTSPARVRPAYNHFVMTWSVLHDCLVNLARFPADVSPRGPQAAAMLAECLPEGISFALLEAGQAWAGAERRLRHIDDGGFAPTIAAVAGPDCLDAVRRSTAALREATGAGPAPYDAASSTAVAEKLADLARLVGMYCRLLAAKYDEADPASVERFKKAVAPLIEYRASRRGTDDDDEEAIVTSPPNGIAPGFPGAPPFAPGPTG